MNTPADSPVVEHGTSFVPALIIRRVATSTGSITEPITENIETAVLFADISGFTALTEKLAGRGAVGMEELSKVISDYFGCLAEVIIAHGGDIVKFAGDAMLALWPATADETLAVATRRATQCALEVQSALRDFARRASAQLELKVALGAGSAICMHVGGVFGRWELLIAGQPFLQAGRAGHHAKPGDVVISREALALIGETGSGERTHDGTAFLTSLSTGIPPVALSVPPLTPPAAQQLLPYIPAAIRARLGAGNTGWFAELRRITVLFVNLPGVTHATPLEEAQRMMHDLQTTIYQYEGSVNKLSVDDKGVTFIGVMGLPPLAHEDDPTRGLQAALALRACLKKLGLKTAIGVTTGRAYCGSVGSPRRREYTIMGDMVNLAARLMQAAPDSILCDAPTYDAAPEAFAFEKLEPIRVKGKAEPIQVYRPLEQALATVTRRRSEHAIVGRHAELATLTAQLQVLSAGGAGAIVMIEGEAGIGKSRLLEEIENYARAAGVRAAVGAADSIERSTPYHAWRGVFSTLLGLDQVTEPQARRDHVLSLLAPAPELSRLAPLLNVVFPLDLPENEITAQMKGELRADNTHDLLLGILRHTASPLLIIIEDAHWKDSASWAFTRLVARDVRSLLLVIATRPIPPPVPIEYGYIIMTPGAVKITLDLLAPEEAIALACRRLGIETLPEPVARMIGEKAGGNPFFTEEMAYALRDAGHIIIDKGQCRIAPGIDVQALSMPDTVEGVVSERIDRLTPEQQLSLKVASVVGRTFLERLLLSVHPVEAERPNIGEHLDVLKIVDLAQVETVAPERLYIFKHIITQQVAYNLMLFAQRRELHRAIAVWYESEYAADLAPWYPTLAHHYTKAEDSAKAIGYLEQAGMRAVASYANDEAISFFNQAMALDEKTPGLSDPVRRALWNEQLGEAYYALGRQDESREHLNRALTLMGRPPPGPLWQHFTRLMKAVVVQTLHRLFPGRFVKEPGPHSRLLLDASRANERLCQIYYMENALVQSMSGAVTALNLAEEAGASPELARSYGNVIVTTAIMLLFPLSDMYERLAIATGKAVGHLPSLAYIYELVGLYHAGAGHWREAEAAMVESIARAESIGDRRRWDEAAFLAAVSCHRHGRLVEARKRYEEIYAVGRRRGIVQVQLWGLAGRMALSLAMGGDTEARGLLEALLAEHGDRPNAIARADAILAFGTMAQAHVRAGDVREARLAAERVVRFIEQSITCSYYLLAGYHGLGETLTTLFAMRRAEGAEAERGMLKTTLATFRMFAFMYPTARPMSYIWHGAYARIDGRTRRARRYFVKSLDWATRLDMPYALAIAHREIARLDEPGTPARQEHIDRARALFKECGAVKDAERLEDMFRVIEAELVAPVS
ncbi:MAG TPA: adenylate/guanylate cyclase domain-containing protein [Burkholderiales bacterium]|nr:adenylate/guanylate cyclase domain-containing protein [Burkholderiales bacterium]